MQKHKKMLWVIGIIDGAASVVLGIITMCRTSGFYPDTKSYGGDAYTGIQNAAAYTAKNVNYLSDIVKFGLGAFLIVFGVALICCFLEKLADNGENLFPLKRSFNYQMPYSPNPVNSQPISPNNAVNGAAERNDGFVIPTNQPISSVSFNAATSNEELLKLKGLLDAGAISPEEFEAKKKQVLGL